MSANKEAWGTRVGLILAMAGNAVGLGNFLRFPVQAVQNGGGAFIIPYLVCFLLMGIPLLWIEWTIGRYGGRFGNHSTPFILDNLTRKRFWKYFGVFGIFTNIGVASYYCYVESWALSYVFHTIGGSFAGQSLDQVTTFFAQYTELGASTFGLPFEAIIFYIICLGINTWILSRGLQGGVEVVARIAMPLLIGFGVFLAIQAITLGDSGSPAGCSDCDSHLGMNYLWEPQLGSLANPAVWLAAAGQIFFTLSVGMGTIHCYAAYVRSRDDIALNAMTAGWMNGFVEVVLGASVVIPIAVGYLGLDWIKEHAGFSMAFQTMPYLFAQWGDVLGVVAGGMWFGLLFFAGITSSLAMGTPWLSFMEDEFELPRVKAALSFGLVTLIVGLPTVFFFNQGVFDEYDYWAGTVSLVVLALAESILFAWVFGIQRGYDELRRGADMPVPKLFLPVAKYVTPALLTFVFLGALVTPKNNDWQAAFQGNWELDPSSIVGKVLHLGLTENEKWFADNFQTSQSGQVLSIEASDSLNRRFVHIGGPQTFLRQGEMLKAWEPDKTPPPGGQVFDSVVVAQSYKFRLDKDVVVAPGDQVQRGDVIARGDFIHDVFFTDMARVLLTLLFAFICFMVYKATRKREREGRVDVEQFD